jgi:hypothetical protein
MGDGLMRPRAVPPAAPRAHPKRSARTGRWFEKQSTEIKKSRNQKGFCWKIRFT